jgi:hypothetical protein
VRVVKRHTSLTDRWNFARLTSACQPTSTQERPSPTISTSHAPLLDSLNLTGASRLFNPTDRAFSLSRRLFAAQYSHFAKPGGHLLFNVWGRIEENVFADDVTNALAKFFPNDPPRFLARTPQGYHDTALIRSEFEDAGFSRVLIEARAEQSRASSPRLSAVAYCQGTVLRNEIEARASGKLEAATDYAASVIAQRHGSGEVAAKIQAHVILAVV